VKFELVLSREEHARALAAVNRTGPTRLAVGITLWVAANAFAIVASLAFSQQLLVVGVGVLGCVLYRRLVAIQLRVRRDATLARQNQQVSISAEGLSVEDSPTLPWSAVLRWQESREFIILSFHGRRHLAIPRRCLTIEGGRYLASQLRHACGPRRRQLYGPWGGFLVAGCLLLPPAALAQTCPGTVVGNGRGEGFGNFGAWTVAADDALDDALNQCPTNCYLHPGRATVVPPFPLYIKSGSMPPVVCRLRLEVPCDNDDEDDEDHEDDDDPEEEEPGENDWGPWLVIAALVTLAVTLGTPIPGDEIVPLKVLVGGGAAATSAAAAENSD